MAEAPLVNDGKVVNVTSSIVTTPLIESRHCLDLKGSSVRVERVEFAKRISGTWSSGTEPIKAEIIAL